MNFFLRLAAFTARILPSPVKQALYEIRPLSKLLRVSLNAAAPQGLTRVQVAAGELQGASMILDLQTEKDYWLGTYEPELQRAARAFVQPGMVIYDVGANIGYISLLLAHLTGERGCVFAFEALPNNVARLQKNIMINHLENRITVIPKAVADASGPVPFLTHSSSAMGKVVGSAGRDERYTAQIRAKGITLDNFVYQQNQSKPALVKMDIEGGEALAIKGMEKLLKEFHPILFIELHGEQAAQSVWNLLQYANYSIFRMSRNNQEITSIVQLDWEAYVIAK